MKNRLFIILLLSTVFLGCKKKANEVKNATAVTCNTSQNFVVCRNGSNMPYSNTIEGDTVNFQAMLPNPGKYTSFSYHPSAFEGCDVLWDFGDGSTSTELSPNHAYDSSGTYLVSFTLNNDSTHTFSNSFNIAPTPIYTHLIAGTRLWRRISIVTDGPTYIHDTTISDTTFTIDVLDNKTISIGLTVMDYLPSSSKANTFVYYSGIDSPRGTLLYLHNTNKISYTVFYGWWFTEIFENI